MDKQVRRLTIDDYDEMIRVWSIAGLTFKPTGRESRELLGAELGREFAAAFGIFDTDRMVALGIANYDGRRSWINRVAVDPDYRGLGLGGEIIGLCEEFLSRFGDVMFCALIEDPNYPSMSLFEKHGYKCLRNVTYWSKRPHPDF
jgi:GNAT superfamily N-acetyltransferase